MSEQSYQSKKEAVLMASNIEMLELLDELLREGKVVRMRIIGGSMLPFLRDGKEQVEVSTPADQELIRGALILFKYADGFILHRIIDRKENRLLIMGDNVYQSRETVTTDQVIGIVRKIIYQGGREIKTDSYQWKILSSCWLLLKPFGRLSQYLIKAGMKVSGVLR